ncbi:unnamed protein product [Symbiodinium sp. CCMP2592]|nr:unnamed protein product [Symbiodinium sp. CCMP2592]
MPETGAEADCDAEVVSCENASAVECGLKKTALDTLGLGEPGIAHVDCDAETTLPATPATPSSYTGSSKTCVLDGTCDLSDIEELTILEVVPSPASSKRGAAARAKAKQVEQASGGEAVGISDDSDVEVLATTVRKGLVKAAGCKTMLGWTEEAAGDGHSADSGRQAPRVEETTLSSLFSSPADTDEERLEDVLETPLSPRPSASFRKDARVFFSPMPMRRRTEEAAGDGHSADSGRQAPRVEETTLSSLFSSPADTDEERLEDVLETPLSPRPSASFRKDAHLFFSPMPMRRRTEATSTPSPSQGQLFFSPVPLCRREEELQKQNPATPPRSASSCSRLFFSPVPMCRVAKEPPQEPKPEPPEPPEPPKPEEPKAEVCSAEGPRGWESPACKSLQTSAAEPEPVEPLEEASEDEKAMLTELPSKISCRAISSGRMQAPVEQLSLRSAKRRPWTALQVTRISSGSASLPKRHGFAQAIAAKLSRTYSTTMQGRKRRKTNRSAQDLPAVRCQAREPAGLARNAGSTEAVLNPSTTAGSMRLILAGEDATGRKPPAPLRTPPPPARQRKVESNEVPGDSDDERPLSTLFDAEDAPLTQLLPSSTWSCLLSQPLDSAEFPIRVYPLEEEVEESEDPWSSCSEPEDADLIGGMEAGTTELVWCRSSFCRLLATS